MLTATYALLSLSVEQKHTRAIFSEIQQHFQSGSQNLQGIDPLGLESVVNQLAALDASCHRRKVEVFVIPAIRKATRKVDSLLAELESLSQLGMNILRTVRAQLRQAFDHGIVQIKEVCCSLELYCDSLLQRLAKEEEELFPIAQRVISSEAWFAIGTQFLSLDAENEERKQSCDTASHSKSPFRADLFLAGQPSIR